MILSGQAIRRAKIISPFNERTKAHGMTYGVGPAGYDIRINQDIILAPGESCLASSVEHFVMPDIVLGVVHDKSTWARLFLAVQNTVIEPGWIGYLTLELSNHGKTNIEIKQGMPIAQIIFHYTDAPVERPYNGKYQYQENQPIPPRFDEDLDESPSR